MSVYQFCFLLNSVVVSLFFLTEVYHSVVICEINSGMIDERQLYIGLAPHFLTLSSLAESLAML